MNFFSRIFSLYAFVATFCCLYSCKESQESVPYNEADSTAYSNQIIKFRSYLLYDIDSAKLALDAANRVIDSTGYTRSLPSLWLNKGKLFFSLGKPDSAIFCYERSLDFSNQFNNKSIAAADYGNIGNVYYSTGDFAKALEMYLEDMKLLEELNDSLALGSVIGNMGLIYGELEDTARAMQFQLRSLAIRQKLNDSTGIAATYGNISSIYYDQKEFEKCLAYSKKSLAMHTLLSNKASIGLVMSNMGEIYMKLGNIDSAEAYGYKAVKIKEEMQDAVGLGYSYTNIASILHEKKKYKQALRYLNMADSIAHLTNDLTILRNTQSGKQMVFEELKQYDSALVAHKLYITYRDSLLNSDKISEINKKEMQFEFDKKEAINQKELEEQKLIRNGLFAGGGFLVIFLLVVYRNYRINKRMNKELNLKNTIIEEKQKEILDSINYAEQIQKALLANHELVNRHIPENFILFKPKDIVSGDFYWSADVISPQGEELFFLACCDSTGHGVPGAFMSLLNINYLNEAVKEKKITEPGNVLNHVRKRLIENLSQSGRKDGMDGILICINKSKNTITYAAANNSPIVVSNGELKDHPYDKMPIGTGEKADLFNTFELLVKKGDLIYLYTDGYADQFGGENGKKFKYKPLNQLLINICTKPVEEQNKILSDRFDEWKGQLEQIDDVCVIGIRF